MEEKVYSQKEIGLGGTDQGLMNSIDDCKMTFIKQRATIKNTFYLVMLHASLQNICLAFFSKIILEKVLSYCLHS